MHARYDTDVCCYFILQLRNHFISGVNWSSNNYWQNILQVKKLARRQNQDGCGTKSGVQTKVKNEGKDCKFEREEDIDQGKLIWLIDWLATYFDGQGKLFLLHVLSSCMCN